MTTQSEPRDRKSLLDQAYQMYLEGYDRTTDDRPPLEREPWESAYGEMAMKEWDDHFAREQAESEAPANDDEPTLRVLAPQEEAFTKNDGDAALDLRAAFNGGPGIVLMPGNRQVVNTGLRVELPAGYAGLVLPRSGLALKEGITVANAPGLIDSSYRGEIGVILHHIGTAPFHVKEGDRIAQLLIVKVADLAIEPVDQLSDTERGAGGFGSTGIA